MLAPAVGLSFYLYLFMLAAGGGMLLGRVDADVLAIADERYRGRIFSLKAVAFAACTLISLIWISEGMSPQEKFTLMHWTPRVMLWMVPLVFVLSWLVDVDIWSNRFEMSAPTFLQRMQFKCARLLLLCWVKVHFRFTVEGAEKVPKTGPVILAANHGSFLDPIFLGCAVPRMVQYLMYSSYYKSLAHPIFRFLTAIPVDEKKHLQALKIVVHSLKQGRCVGIFPEGMVATEKKLNPPQGGVIFLAQHSGAPIVPAAIKGNWDAMPRGVIFPRFKKVTVVFGDPFVVPKDISKKEAIEMGYKLMAAIAALLGVPPPERPAEQAKDAGGSV
jgi:1-acyl-sn-glycerol-3-phosphate acyltransferase